MWLDQVIISSGDEQGLKKGFLLRPAVWISAGEKQLPPGLVGSFLCAVPPTEDILALPANHVHTSLGQSKGFVAGEMEGENAEERLTALGLSAERGAPIKCNHHMESEAYAPRDKQALSSVLKGIAH